MLYTRDTHGADYLQTNEGKHLPVEHCIKEQTDGRSQMEYMQPAVRS